MDKLKRFIKPYMNPWLVGGYSTAVIWGVTVSPWLGLLEAGSIMAIVEIWRWRVGAGDRS